MLHLRGTRILSRGLWLSAGAILVYLAVAKLLVHLLTSTGYGYFVDELYYLAMVKHLDFGYVDVPPLVPALMAISNSLLGTSLFALHVFPALAGAATVAIAGLIAREMGGGRFGQVLAALFVLVAPVWLVLDSWFAYDAFDQLATAMLFYVWVLLMKEETPRRWVALGLVAGLGFLTKLSMAFTCPALGLALLLTWRRRSLATRWPWVAVAIATLVASPFVAWQAIHAWPILTYLPNYAQYRTHEDPTAFVTDLLMFVNPLAAPVLLIGLAGLLFRRDLEQFRTIGLAFVILLAGFTAALHTEARMLVSACLPLLVAGAVVVERMLQDGRRRWIRPAYVLLLAASGIWFAPLALPMASEPAMVAASQQPTSALPDYFAMREGWPEMVQEVAAVYDSLPEADRKQAVILAGTYGEAGAIDFFGGWYGLPPAISNDLGFQVWGPGPLPGDVVIAFGVRFTDSDAATAGTVPLRKLWGEVVPVGTVRGPNGSPWEQNVPVFICRHPRMSLQEMWATLEFYY
ncbi:MAG: glycosyltransferase family 39 protein [Candidatus Limnocylindrales bacterium]